MYVGEEKIKNEKAYKYNFGTVNDVGICGVGGGKQGNGSAGRTGGAVPGRTAVCG